MIKTDMLIMLLMFLIPGLAYSGDSLIASGHSEYPPLMWKEGDKIIGVGPELTSLIFRELGINVNSKYLGPWKRVQHLAQKGEIDLIVGIYKTNDRLNYLSYPDEAYVRDPVVIFVNKEKTFKFRNWTDLIGKKGVTTLGESYGQEFDTFSEKNLDIQKVRKIEQSLKLIASGRIDYTIHGLYPGRIRAIELKLDNRIENLSKPITIQPTFIAISKKSKFIKHINYFNRRIKELKADGTVAKLTEKYIALWKNTQH